MRQKMALFVLVLLVAGLLGSAQAQAQELQPMTPMDLETWFTNFFQVPEDEIEPFANLAFVYQEGNDNSSEQIQQGENNRAYVYQYGEGNYVQQWQNGWGKVESV